MSEQKTLFPLPEYIKNDITPKKTYGIARIYTPVRNQYELKTYCLDDIISKDHKVRAVWIYVKSLDLSSFMKNIKSVHGEVGRPAIDPHLLLALWLYATIEGITNGRVIERYCTEHNAFKWLCGGIEVNYHTINDFRVNNKERLNELLTQSIAIFLDAKLIDLENVSQDGMRVRANANTKSFRRKQTLEDFLLTSQEFVKSLEEENEKDPSEAIKEKNNIELKKSKEQQESSYSR